MAIATHKPTTAPQQVNAPRVQPASYKAITIDDESVPANSLLAYVSGAPWAVDYYQQVIGEHSELRDIDVNQIPAFQQYNKIKNLELRVTTALSYTQNTETNSSELSGSATTYGYLVPNVGDVFISQAGINGEGFYRVTASEKKMIGRDVAYTIEYSYLGAINESSDRYKDLESKVNKTVYFNKDRLLGAEFPHLTNEQHNAVQTLTAAYEPLLDNYLKDFFSKASSTLVLELDGVRFYDEQIVSFVTQITDVSDHSLLRNLNHYLVSDYHENNSKGVYDAILHRSETKLSLSTWYYELINTRSLGKNSFIRHTRFSSIDYVVLGSSDVKAGYEQYQPQQIAMPLAINGSMYADDVVLLPFTHSIVKNSTYALSGAFYSKKLEELSLLERLLLDYMQRKSLNLKRLLALLDRSYGWKPLERFYHLPLIMLLIKTAILEGY